MECKTEIKYLKYTSLDDMSSKDRLLVQMAHQARSSAHAPYSNFRVGAAARLESGEVFSAANVESEVYPAGICAERNLLFSISSAQPLGVVESVAIVGSAQDRECSPCGICRQTLLDVERRQQCPIRVIMCSDSTATVVESAELLLPFSFKL